MPVSGSCRTRPDTRGQDGLRHAGVDMLPLHVFSLLPTPGYLHRTFLETQTLSLETLVVQLFESLLG